MIGRRLWLAAIPVAALACGGPDDPDTKPVFKTRAELLDPETCKECHSKHYREWSGSMHAYAAQDPVFIAMNRRGQEETKGQLGNFCVNCHAPMAVREGATTDGLNLDQVPKHLQGVTCYFCHNVDKVTDTHNNPLELANDITMRGRFDDPVPNPAHPSASSPLYSAARAESSDLCGACHDIILKPPLVPTEIELERTFSEWRGSVFAPERAPTPSALSTCNSCHMRASRNPEPIAEGEGLKVFSRDRHTHQLAGVDVALERFPHTNEASDDEAVLADQRDQIQRMLNTTLRVDLCVQPLLGGTASAIYVTLDNAGAGHNWPSGASQDRRAWMEVIAYSQGQPIYQSGVVQEGQAVANLDDPDLALFRDRTFKNDGKEAHMFWDVARREGGTISAQVTNDPTNPDYIKTHEVRRFPALTTESIPAMPDRVTVRVRISPVGLEVIDDLVATGHLDPSVRALIPTFDLLPNKHLATRPGLEALDKVSMEWSPATRSSKAFYAREDFTKRPSHLCVGMPKGP